MKPRRKVLWPLKSAAKQALWRISPDLRILSGVFLDYKPNILYLESGLQQSVVYFAKTPLFRAPII